MAAHTARRLGDMTSNLAKIVGIELLVAAQGIDLRKDGRGFSKLKSAKPKNLKTSPELERVLKLLRERVPMLEEDRALTADVEAAVDLVEAGAVLEAAGTKSFVALEAVR